MSLRKYDLAFIIGRFSPPHIAHIRMIDHALGLADRVLILLGSVKRPRDIKNPFTFEERATMIRSSFDEDDAKRLEFAGIEDSLYSNAKWSTNVQNKVILAAGRFTNICAVGFKKDASTFYLDLFPQWPLESFVLNGEKKNNFFDSTMVKPEEVISSTGIRQVLFSKGRDYFLSEGIEQIKSKVPPGVLECLIDFATSPEYPRLEREWDHIRKYKKAWAAAPYPPTFVTVDAIVEQSGHVLLVERKAAPGEGLLALPGGFLDPTETLVNAMLRELREETKLKVPEPVLRGCIIDTEVFDSPYRSLRGRTITHAFHIKLPDGPLPKVKGSDDAKAALWVPFNKIRSENMFEDHYSIIVKKIGL